MTGTLEPAVAPDRPVPPAPVSFEAFLAWADEDTWAEWVDGEILLISPASLDHQRLSAFLLVITSLYVESRQLGEIFGAGYLMRLSMRTSGRLPDLLFVSSEHLERVRPMYLDGPADLVVEIVSPESDDRDRGEKFFEYEAAGIPEYWLIDAVRQEAWCFQLGTDARYHPGPIEADGTYHSTLLPGFWLRVAWLWQRPLPPVAEVTGLLVR
jgi:Uma2 family endonuclease